MLVFCLATASYAGSRTASTPCHVISGLTETHGKTGGGYLTQFYPPLGTITYLAITQDMDGRFKFVVAEGENVEGPIFTFGDTNMRMRFSIGAREFANRWAEAGPTHHMAACIGSYTDTIIKVAKSLDVPVEVICR